LTIFHRGNAPQTQRPNTVNQAVVPYSLAVRSSPNRVEKRDPKNIALEKLLTDVNNKLPVKVQFFPVLPSAFPVSAAPLSLLN
jgi:hypothetical protein